MPVLNKSIATVTTGSWTDTSNVLGHSGGYAYTTTLDGTFELYGYDLAALPSTISVTGIVLRLDAWKDTSGGSGTLYIDAQLSWDGGTSWTALKRTAALTTSNQTLYLGGPADTWSHAWTRSELVSNFRVRIKATGASIVDVPEWRLDYVRVSIHYDQTDTITLTLTDVCQSNDGGDDYWSLDAMANSDVCVVVDEGAIPGTPIMEFAGTTETEAQTTPTFTTAAEDMNRIECFGVSMLFFDNGFGVRIADVDSNVAMTGVAAEYQSGALELIEINWEGAFAQASPRPSARFSIARTVVSSWAVAGQRRMDEQLQLGDPMTVTCTIYAFIRDAGGTWHQRVLFTGNIVEVDVLDDTVEFGVLATGPEYKYVPSTTLDERAFTYGDNEGDFPQDWSGTPVPFGYGRFWLAAFVQEDLQSDLTDIFTGAHFASLLGMKVPALPIVPVSIGYKRPEAGVAPWTPAAVFPQALFAVGENNPPAPIQIRTHFEAARNFGRNPYTTAISDYFQQYSAVISWNSQTNRAVVYGYDNSPTQVQNEANDWIPFAGLGDLRGLWSVPTVGTGGQAQLIYMNVGTPGWTGTPSIRRWSGLLGFTALSYAAPNKPNTNSELSFVPGVITKGYVDDDTTPMTLADAVVSLQSFDPRNWIEIHNSDYVPPYNNGDVNVVGLHVLAPFGSGRLGETLLARGCVLMSRKVAAGKSRTKLAMHRRVSDDPSSLDLLAMNGGINIAQVTVRSTLVPQAINDTVTFIAAGFNPIEPWGPNDQPLFDDFKGWNFLNTTNTPSQTQVIQPYVHEVCIKGILEDGVTVSTSGRMPVISAWFEVCFRASIREQLSMPTLTAQRVLPRKRTWHLNWSSAITAVVLGAAQQWGPAIAAAGGSITSRQTGGQTVPTKYTGNVREPEQSLSVVTSLYVHGDGPTEDAFGTYTGSLTPSVPASPDPVGRPVIEKACDIAGHLLAHFAPSSFNARAVSTDFGSYVSARTTLSTYRLTIAITEKTTLQSVFDRIGTQSECFIQAQINDTGTKQFRIVCDDTDPATNQPERMYRTNGYLFRWNRILPSSLQCYFTPGDTLASSFVLSYGMHLPSGTYAFRKYCNRALTNLATEGAIYQAACQAAAGTYNTETEVLYEAPDIWDEAAADRLLKYLVANRTKPLVQIEFDTFANGLDLVPGMVIKLDDSIAVPEVYIDGNKANPVAYPGKRSPTSWSGHQFTVQRVTQRKLEGEPFLVHVVAIETYQPVS